MNDCVFFKWSPRISLIGAFHFFGVKRGTYAATIVERIYDYFCRDANSLFYEYFRFYRKEFKNFEAFLDKKYNLFPGEIAKKKSVFLLYKSLDFEAGGQVDDLMDNDTFNNAIHKYLGDPKDD